jgi:hypothetical protein
VHAWDGTGDARVGAGPTGGMTGTLSRLVPVLVAVLLAGCGDDGQGDEGAEWVEAAARKTTVERVLADPDAWNRGSVVIRGRAYPAATNGFLLVQDGRSIYIMAPGRLPELSVARRLRCAGRSSG